MKIAFLAALLLGIGSAAGAQEAPPARRLLSLSRLCTDVAEMTGL